MFFTLDSSFKRFENCTVKLSAKETKWTSSEVRTRPTFLHTLISNSDTGPVKLPGLSRNGPQGTEFLNRVFQKFLRENNIEFFTVKSGLKASVAMVERVNRTFKNKMYKYFTAKNTLTYIDVSPKLVKSYNNTYHRSIKMKPSQVTEANEAKVWDTLYGSDQCTGRSSIQISSGRSRKDQ